MIGMVFWAHMVMMRAKTVEIPATVILGDDCRPVRIVVQSPDGAWSFDVGLDRGYVDYWKFLQSVSR